MRISNPTPGLTSWRSLLLTAGGLLCAVNLVIFLMLHLVAVFSNPAAVGLLNILKLPASASALISQPWSPLTYMFVQAEFTHLLMNLLWLWAFAFIIQSSAVAARRVVAIYIVGGLAGALAYILLAPSSASGLVGASASIAALMGWILVAIPRRKVHLWLFGEVALWIVVLFVLIVFLFGGRADSWGGHAAHLAGLAAGCYFGLFSRFPNPFRFGRSRGGGQSIDVDNMTLDDLLDKVRRSGYGSLTQAERARLFKVSKPSDTN